MTVYGIGVIENKCHGQGDYINEIAIRQINPYIGDFLFHPLFKTLKDAEKYISELKSYNKLISVELILRD